MLPYDPPAYFLLNPKNEKFVKGQSRFYVTRYRWQLLPYSFLLLFFWLSFNGSVEYFVYPFYSDLILGLTGTTTNGIVSQLNTKNVQGKNGRVTENHVMYIFTASDAKQYTAEKTIPDSLFSELQQGRSISIDYAQADPFVSSPTKSRENIIFVIVDIVCFAAWVILGWFVFVAPYILLRYYFRMSRYGTIIAGKTVEAKSKMTPPMFGGKKNYSVVITFHFTLPLNDPVEDTISVVRNDLKGEPLPQSGTPIAILYLKDVGCEVL